MAEVKERQERPSTISVEHDRWERELREVCRELGPWVREYEPGWFGLDEAAPLRLVDLYQGLVQVGYAKGWLP